MKIVSVQKNERNQSRHFRLSQHFSDFCSASDLIETANISQTHSFPKRTREILIDTVYRQRHMTSLSRLLGLVVVHCGGVFPRVALAPWLRRLALEAAKRK